MRENGFSLPIHNEINGLTFNGDVCVLRPDLVKSMPTNSVALITIKKAGIKYNVMVARYVPPMEGHPYEEQIRLITKEDPRYKMEALIFDKRYLACFPFPYVKSLKQSDVVLGFDIVTKIDGIHHPPLIASKFIPWALETFADKGITHLVSDFEPDSDNGKTYWEEFERTGNKINALERTWAHRQYEKVGFKPDSEIYHFEGVPGFSKPVVFTVYNRKH